MKNSVVTAISALLIVPFAPSLAQEQPKSKFASIIGEVTAIDAAAKKIDLKADSGGAASVRLGDATSYLRVPPGEKDLKQATRINLSDINVGDRVLARVRAGEESAAPANSIIVIHKSELAQYHQKNAAEWQKRGMAGKISALDPDRKEITIQVQTPAGMKDVTVDASGKVNFRRYAPDSVRFSEVKPGTWNDLVAGNNLRVLGEKTEDGSRIKAEEIVSGSFRNIAGTVLSVDSTAGEIKITDLSTKKPLTIKINAESTLKKLDPMMAAGLARMRQAGNPGAVDPAAGAPGNRGRRPGAVDAPRAAPGGRVPDPGETPRAGAGMMAGAGERGEPSANGPGGRMRGGHMDFQQVLERAPAITVADLKAGDALIISSTAGSDPTRATAITLLAGVEPLLMAAPVRPGQDPLGGAWSLDMGMPTQ